MATEKKFATRPWQAAKQFDASQGHPQLDGRGICRPSFLPGEGKLHKKIV